MKEIWMTSGETGESNDIVIQSVQKEVYLIYFFSFPKSKSLSRLKLRRLNEDEKPLMLAVLWMKDPDNNKKFVLQENDPGEIQWEQFSLPELKNFLLILDREEAWYKRR